MQVSPVPVANRSSRKHVLVVGHGFIGSRLVLHLRRHGSDVTVLTRTPSPDLLAAAGDSLRVLGGTCAAGTLVDALTGVTHVVYTAGGLMPAQSNSEPVRDIGLALPPFVALLEALRERPDIALTYLSSGGTVYGNPRYVPIDEGHPENPITSYGVLKLAAEKYVRMYSELYGLRAHVLRCSNVYGPGQVPGRGQGVIATFAGCLLERQPIVLYGHGKTVRDYLYVDDLSSIICGMIDVGAPYGVYNVGAGEGTSLNRILEILQHVTGIEGKIELWPARDLDVQTVVLDVSRLRGVIDMALTPLDSGIASTVAALPSPTSPVPA